MAGRFGSPAPVASVKNKEKWTEGYTVLSIPTVVACFFLADSPSPSSSGSTLLIIAERRIMGNDCLSTALTVVADQGYHQEWLLPASCLSRSLSQEHLTVTTRKTAISQQEV